MHSFSREESLSEPPISDMVYIIDQLNPAVNHFRKTPMSANTAFSSAHRLYVKSLYKRYLTNALDWTINRPLWREQALLIRAEFERNRYDSYLSNPCPGLSPTRSSIFSHCYLVTSRILVHWQKF